MLSFPGAISTQVHGLPTPCLSLNNIPNYIMQVRIVMQVRITCKLFKIIIGRAKRAPHWGVQSRFRVIYVYMYICVSVVVQKA